jgi:RNA polymerase sigma-70 factor (ECF subfamily)
MTQTDRREQLWLQFRRDGDPQVLGELFDCTAADLLHSAEQQCGDRALAEDLVQTTFVVLLESADAHDPARPLLPWLQGILRHRCQDQRRRDARRPGPSPDPLFPGSDPLRHSQSRELHDQLTAALQRLPDRYRRVLTLRLVEQREPAEIAAQLGQSPSATRVQIHRGLQRLRRLLPSSAFRAWWQLAAPRGLAEIRREVLRAAGRRGVATISKGVAVLGLLAAIALVSGWLFRQERQRLGPVEPAPRSATIAAAAPFVVDNQKHALAEVELQEVLGPATDSDSLRTLRGLVKDDDSSAGIPGASIEVFAAERVTLVELQSRRPSEMLVERWNGSLRAVGPIPWLHWPELPEDGDPWTEDLLLSRQEIWLFDRARDSQVPQASTLCDEEGRFRVEVPPQGATLRVSAAGYATRWVPALPHDVEIHIPLSRPWLLSGQLVDPQGRPLSEPVQLLFSGLSRQADRRAGVYLDPAERLGPWSAESSPSGTFQLEVAAASVQVRCTTPGWRLTRTLAGSRQVAPRSFQKETGQPLTLILHPVPTLQVRDGSTGAPIQEFRLLHQDLPELYVLASGRFCSIDGEISLESDYYIDPEAWQQSQRFTVWAEGYAENVVHVPALAASAVVRIDLQPGSCPQLTGNLMRSGTPVAGAVLSLNPRGRRSWDGDTLYPVSGGKTDAAGSFELSAPRGDYVLRVRAAGVERLYPVTVPGSMAEDLALHGRLDVRVLDASGNPGQQMQVFLQGTNGLESVQITDEHGQCCFQPLLAGEYQVSLHGMEGKFQPVAQDRQRVVLATGSVALAQLQAPLGRPTTMRIVSPDSSLHDWSCRGLWEEDWRELPADGCVPLDAREHAFIDLKSAAGITYWFRPDPQQSEQEISVPEANFRYRGIIRDASSGQLLAGLRIAARLSEQPGTVWEVATRSRQDGSFDLPIPNDQSYSLELRFADSSSAGRFRPQQAPSTAPHLEVRVFTENPVNLATIHGRVMDARSHQPLIGVIVSLRSFWLQEHGTLSRTLASSRTATDSKGDYRLAVPAADRYEGGAYLEWRAGARRAVAERGPLRAGSQLQWDFEVE